MEVAVPDVDKLGLGDIEVVAADDEAAVPPLAAEERVMPGSATPGELLLPGSKAGFLLRNVACGLVLS